MNIFIATCKIVSQPRLLRYKKKSVTIMILLLYNNKKKAPWYCIIAIAKGKIGAEIFNLYKQGDLIILEGSIQIINEKNFVSGNYSETIKIINLKVKMIHPTHHLLKVKI
uniref:hypothetical protein n=1 Tax=Caulacanthus ustulatus TaxID=31411 RepID=UPI0027DA9D0E|nr:hypothetical protein REQ00_pgp117 [Caulacanthus ustulatus]WCH57308.1 hypothetical protein [Caulacanthus ustulatus]